MNAALTITIPPAAWLSSNRPVTNHGQRNRIRHELHALAALAATAQRLIARDRPVDVAWTIRYPKGTGWTHGDPTNAHPTTKALLDALVERGYLPGDGPRHVRSETFRRGPNLEERALHVVELALTPASALEHDHDLAVEQVRNRHGAEPARVRALYLERWGL